MVATSAEGGGETDKINEDLWYACAGALACIPARGSLVLYFPQGHSEQVAASMSRNSDARIPSYPNLPWKLACLLLSVSLRADPDTDDVFAKMTLQPLSTASEEGVAAASDPGLKSETTDSEFFCKTLTASDTSTHGGFSVPRRSAENVFPPLDYSVQPPAQELRARDLHGNLWIFRHIYRGQPKRHLLTTGWSTFVTAKRLVAGDSVLFIRNRTKEKELLVGIRRANRQPSNVSSSGLSSESIQIGILAAAAHAYASLSPFTVFYNPRASSSPFVIPMAKYKKAVYSHCADLGTRFRMILEAEDSSKRSHTGTITAIGDVDPVRWNNSRWRNLQVEWDEPVPAERRSRVSIWEIDPVQEPFVISTPPLQEVDSLLNLKRAAPWNCTEISFEDSGSFKKINASTFRPTVTQPQDSLFLPRKQNPSWAYDIPQAQAQAQAQALLEQPASQSFQRVQELPTTTPAEGAFCFPWAGSVLPRTFSGYLENFQETSPSPLLYPSSPFLRECPDQANSVSLDNLLDPLVSDAAVAAEDRVPHSSSTVARDYEAPASFAPALGVLDVATAFESSPMTRASTSWTPPLPVAPPSNKRRTYTKVYKRGAVGRSIDVGRYCGYEKLKRDLARMFNIEGQLEEDRQKRGWKLVYVDHEDDVLLVGDDPWEEFVNCVRCIKILSPQEVDQMSLDGAEAASAPPFLI